MKSTRRADAQPLSGSADGADDRKKHEKSRLGESGHIVLRG